MRIIRFALPSDTFRLVSSCETAKKVWDRMKELYSSDADLEHLGQALLLSEFGAFAQKPDEKLYVDFNLTCSFGLLFGFSSNNDYIVRIMVLCLLG